MSTPPVPPQYPEPPQQPFMPSTEPAPRSRKRRWLFIIALIVVLGLAAGYVFAFYLPAQPSNMYKSGLTNTGKALDALITYSEKHKAEDYKSASFTGSAQVKSAQGSFDFDTSGSVDNKGNGSAALNANIMGQKFQGNLRSVIPKKSTTPDIYFQVNNADKLLSQYGLQKYSEKWIVIDHTMLDTLAKSAENEKDKTTPEVTAPTYDQVRNAIDKVQTLNKQYLFTTDPKYAVLKDQQFIAKEQIHDRTHYHYKVAYNKDHLKTYIAEVKKALDSSKLNEWSEKVNHKKLSEQIKFDDQIKEVDKAKSDYKFDLWVDAKTRVVSQLQFTEVKDNTAKLTIGQNYTGGDQYPFSVSFNDKDDNGHPESGTLNMTIDTKTNKVSFDLTGKMQDASGKSADFSGDFSVTPSVKDLKIDAPQDATPINDVVKDLFGGLSASSSTLYTDDGNPALGISI
jgi:hypothetical protein